MVKKNRIISFLWGFSEATFFFFVPDVWLTRLALINLREALLNTLFALAGALIGGILLYSLGLFYFEQLKLFLDAIPAISDLMIVQAGEQLQDPSSVRAIIRAGFTGIPYKIYAASAGHAAFSFPLFLIASVLARAGRFLTVIILAYGAKCLLIKYFPLNTLPHIHILAWFLFYCSYFYMMGL